MASRRPAAVLSVPDRGPSSPASSAPSDRGKNSYHDPNSARRRCTITGYHRVLVVSVRSGQAAMIASTSGLLAAVSRDIGDRSPSRSAAATAASRSRSRLGVFAALAARSNSSAPSASIRSTSWPSGILMAASCCHPAIGSPHASTRNCHLPSAGIVTSAPCRSVPGASSRIMASGSWLPSGARSTTPAPSRSWPSRNTVALTSKVSPATDLAGRRPWSGAGCTSRMGMRPITLQRYPFWRRPSAPGCQASPYLRLPG